jgi:hypothetical protein
LLTCKIWNTFKKYGFSVNEDFILRKGNAKLKSPLEATVAYHKKPNIKDMPKHGEVDPTGAPHTGGNKWAGGTGGSMTAGLGGVGGPYRLYTGGKVFQVSKAMKDSISEEVRKAAQGT